ASSRPSRPCSSPRASWTIPSASARSPTSAAATPSSTSPSTSRSSCRPWRVTPPSSPKQPSDSVSLRPPEAHVDPSPAIELLSVGKTYGTRVALESASLVVDRGEVFGYVGPNGAGKTTTIKVLAGLVRPTTGDARVLGASVREQPLEVKARIGYVPESGAVFDRFSPREYLRLVGRLHGLDDATSKSRVDEWLARFRL